MPKGLRAQYASKMKLLLWGFKILLLAIPEHIIRPKTWATSAIVLLSPETLKTVATENYVLPGFRDPADLRTAKGFSTKTAESTAGIPVSSNLAVFRLQTQLWLNQLQ